MLIDTHSYLLTYRIASPQPRRAARTPPIGTAAPALPTPRHLRIARGRASRVKRVETDG